MTLTNRELFDRDPTETKIPNDGVAKVMRPETDQQWDVLRWELRSFVCEGEYERGLERILDSFLTQPQPGRAAGGVGERLLRQRQVAPRAGPRVPLARRRAAGRRARPRPRHASRRDRAPPHRAVDRRQARWRAVVGGRHARRRARATPSGSRSCRCSSRAPGCPSSTPGPLHDLGSGERLPRRACEPRSRPRASTLDKEIHDLYVSPVIAKALLDADAEPRRTPSRTCATCSRRSSRRRRTSATTRCSTSWRTCCASSRRRAEAAAHAGRARRDAAVHRRRQREGARRAEHRRGLLGPVREPGARRRHRPERAHRDPDAAEAHRPLRRQVALSDTDVETVVREVVLRKKPEHVPTLEADARGGQRRDRPPPRRHAARAQGGGQAGPRARLPAAADSPAVLGAGAARHRQGRQGRRAANPAEDRPRGRRAGRRRAPRPRRRRRLRLRRESPGMLQSGVLLKEIDELIRGLRTRAPTASSSRGSARWSS